MRIEVDLSRCQGYGNCLGVADDLFDLDPSGRAVVLRAEPPAARHDAARAAARLCPVAAITIHDDAR